MRTIDNINFERGGYDIKRDLREEAHKWIEDIDKNIEEAKTHIKGEFNSKISGLVATRQWIITFFDIRDEDAVHAAGDGGKDEKD